MEGKLTRAVTPSAHETPTVTVNDFAPQTDGSCRSLGEAQAVVRVGGSGLELVFEDYPQAKGQHLLLAFYAFPLSGPAKSYVYTLTNASPPYDGEFLIEQKDVGEPIPPEVPLNSPFAEEIQSRLLSGGALFKHFYRRGDRIFHNPLRNAGLIWGPGTEHSTREKAENALRDSFENGYKFRPGVKVNL